MITGFNTDIEYQGITYHVQTEDKGTATPLILSLVYNGGTILASKRSPYDDLLLENFDEKVLVERLQRQHKLICAAISSGRIEDLKRMSMKTSAKRKADLIVEKDRLKKPTAPPTNELSTNSEVAKNPEPKIDNVPELDIPQPEILNKKSETVEDLSLEQTTSVDLEQILIEERIEAERRADIPIPKPQSWQTGTKEPSAEEIIIEAVEIIEDIEIISADAVEIVEGEKTPSQNFLEQLSRAQNASEYGLTSGVLTIELLSDEEFYSGDEKTLKINVFRGTPENPLSDAHIMVKILGATFAPLLYHAKTDSNGMAAVHLMFPVFEQGRAIVFIKAMSGGDEAEFRRVIKMR